MTKDPVCKTKLDPDRATIRVEYQGCSYFFCSESCHRAFTAEPRRFVRVEDRPRMVSTEQTYGFPWQ